MVNNQSNNKPSGLTAVACDAGTPISARTNDTGVYEIVKCTTEGEIITALAYQEAAISKHPYVVTSANSPFPVLGTGFKFVPITATILDVPNCTFPTQDNGVFDASLLVGVTFAGENPVYVSFTQFSVLSGTVLVYVL